MTANPGGTLPVCQLLQLTGVTITALVLHALADAPDRRYPATQEPAYRAVTNAAELDALPVNTTAVELRSLGQAGLVALAARCPSLMHLRVRGGQLDPFGGEVVRKNFPYLTSLDISGAAGVLDVFVAEAVAVPGLQELVVHDVDITTLLPMLPSVAALRHVDFGAATRLDSRAVEALLRAGKRVTAIRPGDPDFARELAELTDRYADRLDLPFFRTVKSLAELRSLPDGVPCIELHGLGDEAAQLLTRRSGLRAVAFIGDGDDAFSPTAMRRIGELQQLQELHVLVNSWLGEGAEHLASLDDLRSLTMVGVGDAAVAVLSRMRSLSRLSLIGGDGLSAKGIRDLADCTALTDLRLGWSGTMQDEDLVALGDLRSLQRLDLSGASGCGRATLAALGSSSALTSLDLSDVGLQPQQLLGVTRLRSLKTLRLGQAHLKTDDLMALPVSLRNLSLAGCVGLDANAGMILRDRFVELETLDVSRCAWLDDESLQAILQMPRLRYLTVTDCLGPTNASLDALRAAENLRRLQASRSPFLDDEAAVVLRRERPELRINEGDG